MSHHENLNPSMSAAVRMKKNSDILNDPTPDSFTNILHAMKP